MRKGVNKLVYDQRIQPMKQRLVEDAHTQKDSEFRQLSTTFCTNHKDIRFTQKIRF